MSTVGKVNGHERVADPVAQAEAEAIRSRSYAESEARRIEAEGKAKAALVTAEQDAEKQRLANERARLSLEKQQATHKRQMAEEAKKTAEANAARKKAEDADADAAEKAAAEEVEQQRSEAWWKWGARVIYAVGLVIAAPIQFLAFWDPDRPFLVAAPALLEGLALVLAFGAAWAVAHRRDVAPYRVGIMLGALIAAGINLWHGLGDEKIGVNAGIIGAIASLGGPIVLMAYEHGIAQKVDGIRSRRERRAEAKAEKKAAAEKAAAKRERDEATAKAKAEQDAKKLAAQAEQARKDEDRQTHHPEVWELADSLRAARGEAVVTDTIWGDSWFLKTGSRKPGITADIEAGAKAALARMKTAGEMPIEGEFSLINSQKAPRTKRDPDVPDGRRFNGGTPPRRVAGDTQPYTAGAKRQASLEQTAATESH